jgi:hypothetical protein
MDQRSIARCKSFPVPIKPPETKANLRLKGEHVARLLDAPVHSFQAALLNILGSWNRTLGIHLKNVFWPDIFVGASF